MENERSDMPLGFLLNTVGRLIFEETNTRMQGFGVEVLELGILWLVDLYPGCQQSEYARFQRRDATTFGRYVDKLQHKGLLKRQALEGDRRAHSLVVTPKGKAVLAQGRKKVKAAQEAVVGPQSARITEISGFLTDVLASVGAQSDPPGKPSTGARKTCTR